MGSLLDFALFWGWAMPSLARPLRGEFAGALYHVTARGNAGQAIYEDDRDRARFVDLFAREVPQRFGGSQSLGFSYPTGNGDHLVDLPTAAGDGGVQSQAMTPLS